MKKLLAALVAVCVLSGCAHDYEPNRRFVYTPSVIPFDSPVKQKTLVVKKLEESRGPRTYPNSMGSIFKTYIPLLPYVSWGYERLDESDMMTQQIQKKDAFQFTTLVSKALTEDLKSTGWFKEVRYVGEEAVPSDADFVLEGDLNSTVLDTTYSSYFLGMIGVLLWILPFPLARTTGHVDAQLVLKDASGKELWNRAVSGKAKRTYTMYNSFGKPISNSFSMEIKYYGKNKEGVDPESFWAYHSAALRAGMEEAKPSLVQALSKQ